LVKKQNNDRVLPARTKFAYQNSHRGLYLQRSRQKVYTQNPLLNNIIITRRETGNWCEDGCIGSKRKLHTTHWMRPRQWREEGSDVSREDKKRSPARRRSRAAAAAICILTLACTKLGCDLSGLEVKPAEIAAIEKRAAGSGGGIGRSFHE